LGSERRLSMRQRSHAVLDSRIMIAARHLVLSDHRSAPQALQ
jgi:hypothetical protein